MHTLTQAASNPARRSVVVWRSSEEMPCVAHFVAWPEAFDGESDCDRGGRRRKAWRMDVFFFVSLGMAVCDMTTAGQEEGPTTMDGWMWGR